MINFHASVNCNWGVCKRMKGNTQSKIYTLSNVKYGAVRTKHEWYMSGWSASLVWQLPPNTFQNEVLWHLNRPQIGCSLGWDVLRIKGGGFLRFYSRLTKCFKDISWSFMYKHNRQWMEGNLPWNDIGCIFAWTNRNKNVKWFHRNENSCRKGESAERK